MSNEMNYETRPVNEMSTVSASNTRKILSGDGPILLQDILTHINNEPISRIEALEDISQQSEESIGRIEDDVDKLLAKTEEISTELTSLTNGILNIAVGSMAFNAIKFLLIKNGSVSDEYGYLIMKKSDDGNLKFSALTQAEYDEIFGAES